MTDLGPAFDTLRTTRRALAAVVDAMAPDARTAVPPGFRNHVLWNVGHLAVTEQLLTCGLAGRPLHVPDEMVAAFRKGTAPGGWDRTWTWEEVREPFLSLPDRTEADLAAGPPPSFREYTTTPGVVLRSVEDALRFNLYHEGLHLGAVLALRRVTEG